MNEKEIVKRLEKEYEFARKHKMYPQMYLLYRILNKSDVK